jgi:hypothetical protein
MGKLAFLTLTFVTVATIGIIYQVHQSQQEKKALMKAGPQRDVIRRKEKQAKKTEGQDSSKN